MGKLSIKMYAGLCVLGGEVFYAACVLFGTFLSGEVAALHHALFELLPGFTWLSAVSFVAGMVSVAIWSGIGGAYIAWMHNKSLQA